VLQLRKLRVVPVPHATPRCCAKLPLELKNSQLVWFGEDIRERRTQGPLLELIEFTKRVGFIKRRLLCAGRRCGTSIIPCLLQLLLRRHRWLVAAIPTFVIMSAGADVRILFGRLWAVC